MAGPGFDAGWTAERTAYGAWESTGVEEAHDAGSGSLWVD